MNPIRIAVSATAAVALSLTGCSQLADDESAAIAPPANLTAELVARAGAPLFDGMGSHHHEITTADPGAQRYFDQGLIIDFAFNHAESVRSFRAAQTLDPNCAMCYWARRWRWGQTSTSRAMARS